MFQDLTTLVLDIGTHSSRIGYGGDEAPRVQVPSQVSFAATMGEEDKKMLAGNKYLDLDRTDREIQSIYNPVVDNSQPIINKQKYQNFIEFLLNEELRVNLKDYSLLFSEDINKNHSQVLAQREMIAQIAFEKLNVANIYFLKSPVLSCFATGRSTAVVIDSGYNFTRVSAVHDGFILNKTAKIVPLAGKALNSELFKIVENKIRGPVKSRYQLSGNSYNQSFLNYHREKIIEDIKQSFSQGSGEEGVEAAQKISYELPDRNIIEVEKSEVPDLFIYPEQSEEYKGISNMVVETINSSDVDVKKQFYSNILLCGGNMLLGGSMGLGNNILSKIGGLAPPNAKVKPVSICASSERKHLSWIGGSIVTSLSAFQSYWIGKEQYQSVGPAILERKCT